MSKINRDAPNARLEPQFQLATVLGDHWRHRSEPLPTGVLVGLAADFGVTEASARQAIWRLVRRGALVSVRSGRTTRYGLPPGSPTRISAQLSELVNFGSSYPEWDGLWTLVSFSVPTNSRSVLQSLRSRLRRLGLGCLRDGVWLSPHDLVKESLEALEGSALDTAHVFRGTHFARAGEVSLSDVFDTAPLRALYDDFIDRYHDISLDMTPAEALTTRTMLLFDWLSIRRRDPDLPVELLPTDWPRPRAFAIFRQLHQRLGRASEERFREVVAQYSPELAALSLAPDAGLPVPADPAGLRPGLT